RVPALSIALDRDGHHYHRDADRQQGPEDESDKVAARRKARRTQAEGKHLPRFVRRAHVRDGGIVEPESYHARRVLARLATLSGRGGEALAGLAPGGQGVVQPRAADGREPKRQQ